MEWHEILDLPPDQVDKGLNSLDESAVTKRCEQLLPQAGTHIERIKQNYLLPLLAENVDSLLDLPRLDDPKSQESQTLQAAKNIYAGYKADLTRELFVRRGATTDVADRGAQIWFSGSANGINDDPNTVTLIALYDKEKDMEGITPFLRPALINEALGPVAMSELELDEYSALVLHIRSEYFVLKEWNQSIEETTKLMESPAPEAEGVSVEKIRHNNAPRDLQSAKLQKLKVLVRLSVCFQELDSLVRTNRQGIES